MDISKYLARIDYSGLLTPSFEVLANLQKSHLLNVPFENLDIHYGTPIELDIDRIFEKIVLKNRGGFCYELNGLFYHLITSIGFDAKRVSARVFDKEKGYGQEFDHLAILVKINETAYLADVGFGEFIFAPLKIELQKTQKDQRGDFVIDKLDEEYFRVNKIVDGNARPEYIFKRKERTFADYAAMCRYHQSNENSHFTQKRLISLPTENGRITITGNTLKIKEKESTKEIPLASEADFEKALWKYFSVKMEK